MKKEHNFILTDDAGIAPLRIKLEQRKCADCGRTFYIEMNAFPIHCPFCREVLGFENSPYRCGISMVGLSEEEASRFITCPFYEDEDPQQCKKCVAVEVWKPQKE